jgi:hypothetical protein
VSVVTNLDVHAIVTDEVTAVEITGVGIEGWTDLDLKGAGWSKKHPKDEPDTEIAFRLAMARALESLSMAYARSAADLAGFPVLVKLEGTVDPEGDPAAVLVFPDPTELNDLKKKVDF